MGSVINFKSEPKEVTRDSLYEEVMKLYPEYIRVFPQTNFQQLLYARYNVYDCGRMSIGQLQDFIALMQENLAECTK